MQNQIIENDFLKVEIKPLGAELCRLFDKRDHVEHIWQADPKFWPRHAPILFPTIGESKNGQINVEGLDYPMGRHGFARQEEFEVVSKKQESITFELNSNEATRKCFPFEFVFRVSYILEENKLVQRFCVKNTGVTEMGFQLGGHPAFAVPFNGDEEYTDYEVCFDRPVTLERHLLTDDGLYSGKTRPFLTDRPSFHLSYDLFNEDALVFKNMESKKVWIQHKNGGKKLTLEYNEFPHLGIWSVPGANYVCLEPWLGCADGSDQPKDFFLKDSLVVLKESEMFETEFGISLI